MQLIPISFGATILVFTGSIHAQWSSVATSNLAIANGTANQVQPKIAPISGGGCYMSWFDSTGYDVRLQLLDAAGREQWKHGGVLIADRGFSSTQDYALDIDVVGNALLAFRDDRGTGTQITAAKVDRNGKQLWGASGVQLTNTTTFLAAPKIAGTSDGHVVAAWTQGPDVHAMKLNPSGKAAWKAPIVLSNATKNFAASDMHASDKGSVIIAMQLSGKFFEPRHLYAQKLDANGALLWGAAHVAVFDGGSLQMGNYPKFVVDGAGGAVFGWYSTSPAFECSVQRLLKSGAEQFPHNGVSASTDASKGRVNPDVSFDPVTQETFLVYREQRGSTSGVSAQKFGQRGKRQWTATGVIIAALGTSDIGDLNCLATNSGVMGFWTAAPSFGTDQVFGAQLDGAGKIVGPFAVSSSPAVKYRVNSALSSFGFAILAWRDEGSGNPDILAQNILPHGKLGGLASAAIRNGTKVNPTCFTSLTLPAIGTTWRSRVAHPPTALTTATFISIQPTTGPIVPGFGEILAALPAMTLGLQTSKGVADTHSLRIPAKIEFVGPTLATQALVVSPSGFQLCNAIDITIGL